MSFRQIIANVFGKSSDQKDAYLSSKLRGSYRILGIKPGAPVSAVEVAYKAPKQRLVADLE